MTSLGRAIHTPTGIATQADGNYLVSYIAPVGLFGAVDGGIVRFNADHTPDISWGYRGVAGSGNSFSGLTFGAGKLLAIENGSLGNGGNGPAQQYQLTFVSRYTADGQLDPTFGGVPNGNQAGQTIPFPAGGTDISQRYDAIALAPDGKIVVAGESSGSVLVVRYSAAGILDTSFGIGGWTRLTVGAGGNAGHGVAVQADGKIVVAGNYGTTLSGFVARLGESGALDSTFNGGGVFLLPTAPGASDCRSVLLDGSRIIVGCTQSSGGVKDFLLLGLTATGAIDAGFDNSLKDAGGANDVLNGLFKHPDGRIFAVGQGGAGSDRMVILAVNADGTRAGGFANNGVYVAPEAEVSDGRAIGWNGIELILAGFRTVTTDDDAVVSTFTTAGVRTSNTYTNLSFSSGHYWRVKALPNGKILAAGNTHLNTQSNFLATRFNANGALDASFGTAGHSTISTVDVESFGLRDFALQVDGKIVMSGDFGRGNPDVQSVGAARMLANGGVDTSFNAAGTPGQNYLVIPDSVNAATGRAIRVQADGKILVVSRLISSVDFSTTGGQALVVRFNADGTVDSTYGLNGVAKTSFATRSQSRAMDLDAAGRAVLTGDGSGQVRLARFNTSGVLDPTFGSGGMVSYAMPSGTTLSFTGAKAIVLPDGKILAMLVARTATDGLVGLMRVDANGALDSAFGTGGFSFAVVAPGNVNSAAPFEIAITPSGRIVVAGAGTQGSNLFVPMLVRFLPNGTPDYGFGSGGVRYYPYSDVAQFIGLEALRDGSLLIGGDTGGGGQSFGLLLKTLADPTANLLPSQIITFGPLVDRPANSPPFTVSATGGASGNPVVFASTTAGICTTSGADGSTITLTAATGICTLIADQAGNLDYNPAVTVTRSFSVRPVYTASSPAGGNISLTWAGGGTSCDLNAFQFIRLTGDAQSPPDPLPGVPFPHGLFVYTLNNCTPGNTVTFTIIYPTAFPAGTLYYKYGPTAANTAPHWYVLPGASVNGNIVTFSVTDGGVGDDDLAANGTIVDPGGPGVGAAFTVTSSAGANGSIVPSGARLVGSGTIATFTVTPEAGYSANVGGNCGGNLAGNAFTTNPITADCTVDATFAATAVAPALVAVLSRKTHGSAGPFDLRVDTSATGTGAVTIESRAIGGGHTLIFQFSGPVASIGGVTAEDAGSVSVGTASAAPPSGSEVVVTLPDVPDTQRVKVSLAGINGVGTASVWLGFMVGDVDDTRTVSPIDISRVKARSGQTADEANFRYDVNSSGTVNASDIAAVKARSGRSMP